MIRPLAKDIVAAMAVQEGVTVHALLRASKPRLAHARQRAAYVIKNLRPEMSYPLIGAAIERHHNTVMHAVRAVARRVASDPAEANKTRELTGRAMRAALDNEINVAEARLAELKSSRAAWNEQVTA